MHGFRFSGFGGADCVWGWRGGAEEEGFYREGKEGVIVAKRVASGLTAETKSAKSLGACVIVDLQQLSPVREIWLELTSGDKMSLIPRSSKVPIFSTFHSV